LFSQAQDKNDRDVEDNARDRIMQCAQCMEKQVNIAKAKKRTETREKSRIDTEKSLMVLNNSHH
jgi:hypothetical protein